MSHDAARYTTVANGFTERLAAISTAQWTAPTPCSEWNVRDLVAHVVTTHRRVLATLSGSDAAAVDAEGDLRLQWFEANRDVAEAAEDPESGAAMVRGMSGEQTFGSLVGGLLCTDTLVHTWDLSRAIGHNETLDPDVVTACAAVLAPADNAIRRPGGFGPKIDTADDVDEQTRFLCFCGRAV